MKYQIFPYNIDEINRGNPGDIFILNEGNYGIFTFNCKGNSENRIIVSANKNVVFESGLIIKSEYTDFRDFEVKGSKINRQSKHAGSSPKDINKTDGLSIFGKNNKLIHLVIHDSLGNNIGCWKTAFENEIYGCILYNCGWDGTNRGHGYNIYTQNEPENGVKTIENCFVFNSHRNGINAYGTGKISGYKIINNTVFNNGSLSKFGDRRNLLVGGSDVSSHIEVKCNTFYKDGDLGRVQLGYDDDNEDVYIEDNYFINESLFVKDWKFTHITGNTFIHDSPVKMYFNKKNNNSVKMKYNTYFSDHSTIEIKNTPSINAKLEFDRKSYHLPRGQAKNSVDIIPNKYDESRFHITVRNPELLEIVPVDLSDYLEIGAKYEIIDVQNYFGGPVATGTYKGGDISLPMTLTEVSKPIGNVSVQPKHTGIELGTFIFKTKQI